MMDNEHSPKCGENQGVQYPENVTFSTPKALFELDQAPFNPAKRPLEEDPRRYRKIRVYTKSLARYRKERERRRKVRELTQKGYTRRQIAEQLGVSARTVKRDWNRVRSYVKGQANRKRWEEQENDLAEFEKRYEGLSREEKLKLIRTDLADLVRAAKRFKRRAEPHYRKIDLTVNLDLDSKFGLPPVEVHPNLKGQSAKLARSYDLTIYALKYGQKWQLCSLHVG